MPTPAIDRLIASLKRLPGIGEKSATRLTFFLLRLMPGGPFDKERELPSSVRENIERKWKLDKPLIVQYGSYLSGLLRLDMGESMARPGRTVRELLMSSAPKSLLVGGAALAFAMVFGLVAGIIAAVRQNRAADYTLMSISMLEAFRFSSSMWKEPEKSLKRP